jgi:mono/diheme cytochrome c family protein
MAAKRRIARRSVKDRSVHYSTEGDDVMNRLGYGLWLAVVWGWMGTSAWGGGNAATAQEGYRLLLDRGYLPADFSQEVWEKLWLVWEPAERKAYEAATPAQKQAQMYERYGFQSRPNEPDSDRPLQYTRNEQGGWVMNCFTCHGGKVNGVVIPGAPNTHIALQTLIDDVRLTKLSMGKELSHMDVGSLMVPLGTTRGTTNAINFGVALATFRDFDLNYRANQPPRPMTHHDVDAPAWWNVKRKSHLYAEGFAPRSHRSLMQFLMVPANGPQQFADFEEDFRKIYDYILSLEAPKYPFPVDTQLAAQGEVTFRKNCAECHGTYGQDAEYPNRNVPLDEIGTDPVRYQALGNEAYEFYDRSWFNRTGNVPVNKQPEGYVAPPLNGVWATAPYFHNGSVPTLWHVLHSDQRPVVWKRTEDGFDTTKVGLEVEELADIPSDVKSQVEKRYFFDTRKRSKGAGGHTFPDGLSAEEKTALLEYLKTL